MRKTRARNYTGLKFGRLTFIRPTTERKHGKVVWICKCDCGREWKDRPDAVISGRTVSCGCSKRKLASGIAMMRLLKNSYKVKAKLKKIPFRLLEEEFKEITQKNCFYCGIKPEQRVRAKWNGDYIYNGIDRVDNSKGYTLENCVPCCEACNKAKRMMTSDEFAIWVKKVYEFWAKNK